MTAQIVVMNKNAVAMASDSAVTVDTRGSRKIYNTANKLFCLSRSHPLGLMIFGNDSFAGVPWETLANLFRDSQGSKGHEYLREYVPDLIDFLRSGLPRLVPAIDDTYIELGLASAFAEVWRAIRDATRQKTTNQKTTPGRLVHAAIKSEHALWKDAEDLDPTAESDVAAVLTKHPDTLETAIEKSFRGFPISKASKNLLKEIGVFAFSKRRFTDAHSGLVFSGFGGNEIFPALSAISIEGMLAGHVKYKIMTEESVDLVDGAGVYSFAQKDVVSTFMEGVDPVTLELFTRSVRVILDEYPKIILSLLKIPQANVKVLLRKLRKAHDTFMEDFKRNSIGQMTSIHVNPVMRAVGSLPKDELASMAESLVNLTSFRRRISTDDETVGGPVDVAVISKGDGFVWIRRKRYFESELNPGFVP